MKTVAMGIIFEGEDAENFRDTVMNTVIHTVSGHEFKASVEITSWDESSDSVVVEGIPEKKK